MNDKKNQDHEDQQLIAERLRHIRRVYVVLSGKGGVGKSTVAVNLATSLMLSGLKVGLLDVDIHGPSIPTMLGLEGCPIQSSDDGIIPVDLGGMKVMSIAFLLPSPDDAVIWRGPMKMSVIKQFLKDVVWGDLDCLIIDSPPGTGDEPLSVCQLVGRLDGAVIVTTPQKVAAVDVRKSISFCRRLEVPVAGVVENMSGFVCPKCGEFTPILCSGAGQKISEDMKVPFLGSIPIDPKIAEACDDGRAFIQFYSESPTAKIMKSILDSIGIAPAAARHEQSPAPMEKKEVHTMRVAIPTAGGKLSLHFGHCEKFVLLDLDTDAKKVLSREEIDALPHQPGLLPAWLAERDVQMIIAGGMGQRAQNLFLERGIEVIIGAQEQSPEKLAADYMNGRLASGENICDH